jgi:hypothetical protein
MSRRVIGYLATVLILWFAKAAQAQTPTTATSPSDTQASAQQQVEQTAVYEGSPSAKLSTATLAALHRIHLDKDDRKQIEALANAASEKSRDLVKKASPSPYEFGEARESAEDVCREFSKAITSKLRGIEKGTTGWELLSSLATGVGIGSTVIGSARVAAVVAGSSTAWGRTWGKPDTEHGSDALSAARAALSEIRMEYGRLSDDVNELWLKASKENKTKYKQLFGSVTASFINACKG